jgi:hypothetical protein
VPTNVLDRRAGAAGTISLAGHFLPITWEPSMPYTRPVRRFYLTPPRVLTFVISVVLAVLAALAVYGHLAALHGINGFAVLLVAYLILAAGALIRGI